jgi:hypothetical protein
MRHDRRDAGLSIRPRSVILYAIFSLIEGHVTGWAHRKTELVVN